MHWAMRNRQANQLCKQCAMRMGLCGPLAQTAAGRCVSLLLVLCVAHDTLQPAFLLRALALHVSDDGGGGTEDEREHQHTTGRHDVGEDQLSHRIGQRVGHLRQREW